MSKQVKLTCAALDEFDGKIIIRGLIDPDSLQYLMRDEYQREVLPLVPIERLCRGFEEGKIPDIELGMRGERVDTGPEESYFLKDDVYIIDGLQRVTAALQLMKKGKIPRLGAMVHFGTTEEWERQRFRILNAERTKLSPNVLARNLRHESVAVELLFKICGDANFALRGRVQWAQRMNREHLITAVVFLKSLGVLHSKFGPGKANKLLELVRGLDKILDQVKRSAFKENVRTFFDLIDDAWGLRAVAFRAGTTHLKGTFLLALAQVLADHRDFWREQKLTISGDLRKKIAGFPINDKTVINLASSGGQARAMLYQLIVNHINSGKRTKRLTPIDVQVVVRVEEEAQEEVTV